ncbi:MAG: hypothetical protein JWQ38_3378 [Flavipsychrobacter sp.]|nr:hypothetical protein [Flavipsychrobacter sp.]
MNRIFIFLLGLGMMCGAVDGWSQAYTTPKDTITLSFAKSSTGNTTISNKTANNLRIYWRVINTDFPSDWLTGPAFGICDNYTCLGNIGNTLWDASLGKGDTMKSIYYSNSVQDSAGSFGLSMDLSNAPSIGTHWVKVNIIDSASGLSKDITFIVNKLVNSTPVITRASDNIAMYPNPATSDLNVVFDATADVKNIAVYNIIGKVMSVYKVTGNSANLNIENIPSGIYFVKLYNGSGNAVVTRKFTKQ